MKLIFIVLLVGNIAFFLFQFTDKSASVDTKPAAAEHKVSSGLQTIAERERRNKSKDSIVAAGQQSDTPANNGSGKCELIGPFAELLHAEYLVERLNSLDAPSIVKQVEIADGKNYWVYLK